MHKIKYNATYGIKYNASSGIKYNATSDIKYNATSGIKENATSTPLIWESFGNQKKLRTVDFPTTPTIIMIYQNQIMISLCRCALTPG
jgi:hypothetical protein